MNLAEDYERRRLEGLLHEDLVDRPSKEDCRTAEGSDYGASLRAEAASIVSSDLREEGKWDA